MHLCGLGSCAHFPEETPRKEMLMVSMKFCPFPFALCNEFFFIHFSFVCYLYSFFSQSKCFGFVFVFTFILFAAFVCVRFRSSRALSLQPVFVHHQSLCFFHYFQTRVSIVFIVLVSFVKEIVHRKRNLK